MGKKVAKVKLNKWSNQDNFLRKKCGREKWSQKNFELFYNVCWNWSLYYDLKKNSGVDQTTNFETFEEKSVLDKLRRSAAFIELSILLYFPKAGSVANHFGGTAGDQPKSYRSSIRIFVFCDAWASISLLNFFSFLFTTARFFLFAPPFN